MNFMQDFEEKEQFVSNVQKELRDKAFAELEELKKQMSNEFLKSDENGSD